MTAPTATPNPASVRLPHHDMTPAQVYRRLLRSAKPYWRMFLVAMLALAVYAATQTGLTMIMKPLVDEGFVARNPQMMRLLPLGVVAIFFFRGLSQLVSAWAMSWVGRSVIRDLRREVFDKYLRLPVSYYDAETSGNLVARLTYHVEQVAESTTSAITSVIKDGLTVVGLLIWIFYLDWKLSSFVFVIGPIIGGIIVVISRRFRKLSRRIQDSMGDTVHVADEVITGHRVVKVFGGQAVESERFSEVNEYNRAQHIKLVLSRAGSTAAVQWVGAIAIAAVLYFAIAESRMTPGTFVSFLGGLIALLQPLRQLTNVNEKIQRGIAAAADIFDLLDAPSEPDTGTLAPARVQGGLRFEGVSMRYANAESTALHDISLDIAPGEVVAFVGRSGSGKSTLLSLIPRFYRETGGRILLDGKPMDDYSLSAIRSQIALVDQHVKLFNTSVANNIAYGGSEAGGGAADRADESRIIDAAKHAHAWGFIEQLDHGLETEVGMNGVTLSGGQRQRIAIARAILKDAPILILDEATSALDTESERAIQAALEGLMVGRTTLVIAHRLSTIQSADRIVVLDQGRIVEQGTHAELLALSGHYAALHALQFAD